ncbi:MAG: ion transporter, partial [Mariprofundaceae bacterium]
MHMGITQHSPMAAESRQTQAISLRQWLDMHLNDLSTGATRYINMFFIGMIMASVLCTMLLTVPDIPDFERYILHRLEVIFAFTFLGEYLLRLYAAPSRLQYIFSLYGIIDLCAVVPALAGFNQSIAIRMLRMIAIIRLLKLMRYARDVQVLLISLRQSIGILFGVAAAIMLMAV